MMVNGPVPWMVDVVDEMDTIDGGYFAGVVSSFAGFSGACGRVGILGISGKVFPGFTGIRGRATGLGISCSFVGTPFFGGSAAGGMGSNSGGGVSGGHGSRDLFTGFFRKAGDSRTCATYRA